MASRGRPEQDEGCEVETGWNASAALDIAVAQTERLESVLNELFERLILVLKRDEQTEKGRDDSNPGNSPFAQRINNHTESITYLTERINRIIERLDI